MKKKGFTLIELIVVIAIIGVLAAILVPAMLGYVRKSKITTANTTAKSIYNAYNTAIVDYDTIDESTGLADGTSTYTGSTIANTASGFNKCVYGYFTDIAKVKDFAITIKDGACTACGVMNGKYPGAYPDPWTPEAFEAKKPTSASAAMAGPNGNTTTTPATNPQG